MSETGAPPRSELALPAAIVVAYAFARGWLLHEAAIVDIPRGVMWSGFVARPLPLSQIGRLWPALTVWLVGPLLAGAIGSGGERAWAVRYVGWARALGWAMTPLAVVTALLIVAVHAPALRAVASRGWWLTWPALVSILASSAVNRAEPRRGRRWLGAAVTAAGIATVELTTLWPLWKAFVWGTAL